MAICNVLIKVLDLPPKKFLLLLDSAIKNKITSFQILPAGTLSVDAGEADADPLMDPNESPITCVGPGLDRQFILLSLEGATDPLFVGQQGTGAISDNRKGTEASLLWKVISIAGRPPQNWRSMDIFQDLPPPPDNQRVA